MQIYIDVNLDILKLRNNKKIYSKKKNIVGKDIKFPVPYNSDFVIKNDFTIKFLKNIKLIKKKIYVKI